MYAGDNNECLAINSDHSTAWRGTPSWISGWLDWSTASVNTNTDFLVNDNYSLLGSYLGHNYNVFACPAANYVSAPQRKAGWDHRCRSVSMDAALGDGAKYDAGYGVKWYVAKKSTDLRTPGPSDTWVFTDEHPDCIDDGILYTPNYPFGELLEIPGCQHNNGCGLGFADGHAEMHRWRGKFSSRPVTYAYTIRFALPLVDPDMLWIEQRTPQHP